jgi:hypothetical protein
LTCVTLLGVRQLTVRGHKSYGANLVFKASKLHNSI